MIIAVSIHTLANMLETVVIELSKERTISLVPKVFRTHVLFKQCGYMNVKSSSMGLP